MKKLFKLLALCITFVMILSGCGEDYVPAQNGGGSSGGGSSHSSKNKTEQKHEHDENDGPECDWCDGSGECLVCEGNKECRDCTGTKKVVCYSCWGSNVCMTCGADGKKDDGGTCAICKGSGECNSSNCDDGYSKCYTCSETGLCHGCDGSGECETCYGTGTIDTSREIMYISTIGCTKCNETGVINCEDCTDGDCYKCGGDGNNGSDECSTCKGLGICKNCKGQQSMPCSVCIDGYKYEVNFMDGGVIPEPDPVPPIPDPDPPTPNKTCSRCHGKGSLDCTKCTYTGNCSQCNGKGSYFDNAYGNGRTYDCTACNKTGRCSNCKGKAVIDCPSC